MGIAGASVDMSWPCSVPASRSLTEMGVVEGRMATRASKEETAQHQRDRNCVENHPTWDGVPTDI